MTGDLITYHVRAVGARGLRVLTNARAGTAAEAVAKVRQEFSDYEPLETVIVSRWAPEARPEDAPDPSDTAGTDEQWVPFVAAAELSSPGLGIT